MVNLTSKAKLYLYSKVPGDKAWKYLRAAYDANGLTPGFAYLPKTTTAIAITGGVYHAFDQNQWVRLSADPAEAWGLFSAARTAAQVASIKHEVNSHTNPEPAKTQPLTIGAAVAAMLEQYTARTQSKRADRAKESTLRKLKATLGLFERHFGSATLFKSLTREQVMDYIDNHQAHGHESSQATKQGIYVYVSRLLVMHDHIILKKGDRPVLGEPQPIREYSDAEIDALMAVSDEYHQLIWETLKWTGLRKMELLTLYKSDVHYDAVGKVYYLSIAAKPELGFSPKTKKPREVVIPDELAQRLLKYDRVPGCKLLFPTKKGMINHDLIWQLKSRVKLAGLDPTKFKIHSFRSTCASRAIRNGVPIPDVKEHLGHSEKSNVIWRYAGGAGKVARRSMMQGMYTAA